MSDGVFLAALSIVFGSLVLMSIARVVRRYLEGRAMRAPAVLPEGLTERLERIETAVETTAVEVERIAEANRFMSKLLAERAGAVTRPREPERVITPH
jgi:hypothetical protein